MHGFRSIGAFLLIVGSFALAAASADTANKFRKLSEREIRAKVAGMEITDDVHWADLYNRDGTFTSWSMGKKRTGKWTTRDGMLCLDGGKEPPECKEVWVSGDKMQIRVPGDPVPFDVMLRNNNRAIEARKARRLPMKWITRERVKVDRVACPWLIRKFIDPNAEFLFVPADRVMETAKREGATPYDVKGVELGHHGAECSFDALVKKYNLGGDPALVLLAKIVNGADTDNALWNQPEAAGLEAIAEGFRHLGFKDDHAVIAAEAIVYDALYAYAQEMVRRGKPDGQFR